MENKKKIDQVKSSISHIPKEKMDIKKIPIEIFLSPLKTKKVKSFDYYYSMNQHYSNYYRIDIYLFKQLILTTYSIIVYTQMSVIR